MGQSLIFVVLFALAGSTVGSESLGDAAKREEARRKKNREQGVTARVIPSDQVRSVAEDPAASEPAPGTEAPSPGTPASGTSPAPAGPTVTAPYVPPDAAKETRWRQRAEDARNRVLAAEKKLEKASQATLPEHAYNSCPHGMNMVTWMMRLEQGREQARQELAAAKTAVADLEEQARREGALPGWLR